MRNTWHDLETFSPTPIKGGTHKYAEKAEVMLWAWADEDGPIYVWDLINGSVHWQDELSGLWSVKDYTMPTGLWGILADKSALVWFQNGGQFDFPVLRAAMPVQLAKVDMSRWRDTMVQAFSHALPGALDKLGSALNVVEDKRKLKHGKKLIQLFCKPRPDGSRATKQTHPAEWQEFIEYAGADIVIMREAHRLMPTWNYKTGKQVDLWHNDLTMNFRGFAVDVELAEAAVKMADKVQARLAKETKDATGDQVQAATQRDALLAYILDEYGVTLPDMQSSTLERRLDDPDLPQGVRDLIAIRLQASMNSVAKYKTLLKGVSSDGRMRGTMQFRGAGRTGRWAHRLFQPGNLPRSDLPQNLIDLGIDLMKAGDPEAIELAIGSPMRVMSNAIRGCIVAPVGKKLVIADLSNIEGRVAAWLAGEETKLQAFRDFDAGIGADLYVLAYAKSFNVTPESVGKPERQIGKVEELMFGYGGGVGAWLTGAATYGIDLDAMTEAVMPVLPEWAVVEARSFLEYLYKAADKQFYVDNDAIKWRDAKLKARYGLPEETFVACDAIKRTWRRAHPMISSYWAELEAEVRKAISAPGVTFTARKIKVRRDGAWLRLGLPSGRALCYPSPAINKSGEITYTGHDTYTRQWGPVKTYGGKLFENITQAVACDQFAEAMPWIEAEGYALVLGVHDEWITEAPDESVYTPDRLAYAMCRYFGWNDGLPLAAKGFETYRYRKE
jgi:DNA polymerase bacteriophage-type